MFVWEVLAHRLRMQGYQVMRTTYREGAEMRHLVHLSRGTEEAAGTGPTLTEALADAARRGRMTRIEQGFSCPPRRILESQDRPPRSPAQSPDSSTPHRFIVT